MLYGQASAASVGTDVLTFTLTDGDSATVSITDTINVVVNSMPYPTSIGIGATLSSVDPCLSETGT
jgi:hypothetical protein